MHIEEAPQELKTNVNEFYRTMGYHSGRSDNEQAYCFLADDVVKGCVQVEKIHGIRMLRGRYLQKKLQSKGFGTLLIKHIEPVLNEATSYCLPFAHLSEFYGQIGFEKIPCESLPDFLITRFKKYQEMGHKIIAMKRKQVAI
jgi:GNAT superfamily N-acetyltransferase